MQSGLFAIIAAVLFLVTDVGSRAIAADVTGWRLYRNDQYSVELKYPPDYAIVQLQMPLQPPSLLRVWFKEARLINSPIADREPPQFAIDVYENLSSEPLEAWLASSGVTHNLARLAQEVAQVGDVPGLRLTDQAMLAPNIFYYVARGRFVYRLTPLGGLSDEILATFRFTH